MLDALLVVVAAETQEMGEVEKVFQQPTFMMVLGKRQGECEEGERVAVFAGEGKMVPGCWFERHGTVWVVWVDGDRSAVPAKMFKKPEEA